MSSFKTKKYSTLLSTAIFNNNLVFFLLLFNNQDSKFERSCFLIQVENSHKQQSKS